MNSGGYLGMPIATIKHHNLSSYGKISTCKLCNCGDLRNLHRQLQCYRVLIHLEIHGEKERRGSKKLYVHEYSTDFTIIFRNIVISLSSL